MAELKAGIKIRGQTINTLRHADATTLLGDENKEKLLRARYESKKCKLKNPA